MRMSDEANTRRPHDLRQEAVVQVEKVGSENVGLERKGVSASGLDCMYLVFS